MCDEPYFYRYWQMREEGYRVSRQKMWMLGSVGVTSIWAWGFLGPFYAFFVSNFYHALQYFAIVWAKEKNAIGRVARISGWRHAELAALAIFVAVLVGAGIAYKFYGSLSIRWGAALFTVVSLMHFWYDSFVWSVRGGRTNVTQ